MRSWDIDVDTGVPDPSDLDAAGAPPLANTALPYASPDTRVPAPRRSPDSIKWAFLGFALTVIAVLTGAYVGAQYLPPRAALLGPAFVILLLAVAAAVMRWRWGWREMSAGIAAALALILGGVLASVLTELIGRRL